MNFNEYKSVALGSKTITGNKCYIIYRKISLPLSFLLYKYSSVTPNQVSYFMLIVTIIGVILLIPNDLIINIIALILLFLGFIFDKIDGELARTKKIFSKNGKLLDNIYHTIFWILFPLVIAINHFLIYRQIMLFPFALIIILVNIVFRINKKLTIEKKEKKQGIKEFIYFVIFHQINFFIYGSIVYIFFKTYLQLFFAVYSILFLLIFILKLTHGGSK